LRNVLLKPIVKRLGLKLPEFSWGGGLITMQRPKGKISILKVTLAFFESSNTSVKSAQRRRPWLSGKRSDSSMISWEDLL
jgi:hypothetical protein